MCMFATLNSDNDLCVDPVLDWWKAFRDQYTFIDLFNVELMKVGFD